MTFKPQPAGSQRTLVYKVRFKPHFSDVAEAKLEWLRQQKGYEKATISDLIRVAVDRYCRESSDPRDG